jgi:hypothetical protein
VAQFFWLITDNAIHGFQHRLNTHEITPFLANHDTINVTTENPSNSQTVIDRNTLFANQNSQATRGSKPTNDEQANDTPKDESEDNDKKGPSSPQNK